MVSFLREGVLRRFSGGYAWESFVKGVLKICLKIHFLYLGVVSRKAGFFDFSPIPLEFPGYPPPGQKNRGFWGKNYNGRGSRPAPPPQLRLLKSRQIWGGGA